MTDGLSTQHLVRNYFRSGEYFSTNLRNGVTRSPSGARYITVPEDFMRGMQSALEDETGAAAPIVLYACGKWWGKAFVRRLFGEFRQLYKMDTTSMPTGLFAFLLRRAWSFFGWGKIELSFELREHGFVEAIVTRAMYSEVVGGLGRTTEHLMAGVLASLISELAGRELACAQTMCTSKGDPHAVFLIGLAPRVEVVATWVKQGKNHSTVRESIASGDLI